MTPASAVDVEGALAEMVRRIVDRFQPRAVILFGSHARGEATADSDVDLLVVTPDAVAGRSRDLAIDIRMTLRGSGLPKDIVVLTPEELQAQKDIVGTIAFDAVREGRLLYERPA